MHVLPDLEFLEKKYKDMPVRFSSFIFKQVNPFSLNFSTIHRILGVCFHQAAPLQFMNALCHLCQYEDQCREMRLNMRSVYGGDNCTILLCSIFPNKFRPLSEKEKKHHPKFEIEKKVCNLITLCF